MAIITESAARLSSLAMRASSVLEPLKGLLHRIGVRLDRFSLDGRFANLTSRIIALNMVGLAIVVVGILFFTKTQAWLIDAKKDSLVVQGDIIALAIAQTATGEDEERSSFFDRAMAEIGDDIAGEAAKDSARTSLQLAIRPEQAAYLLKRLVKPTGMRARVYTSDGTLVLDTDLFGTNKVTVEPLTPNADAIEPVLQSFWTHVIGFLNQTKLEVYRDIGRANGMAYPEVANALKGERQPLLLLDDKGRHMVSVAVPIQRQGLERVHGVLLLSTQGGEIEQLIWRERRSILRIAGFALAAMLISSFLLARTIAWPLKQLSEAAERVQHNLRRREELPDFTRRTDEIGHLSRTLTDMTDALYKRIEASERFAADVAHELKNPLTSVRSAAETLAIVKSDADRQQLADTIQHDVKRMTRLIDDISKATRVDGDFTLNEAQPVDLADLLTTVAGVFNDVHAKNGQRVSVDLAALPLGSTAYTVNGNDLQLGQVFNNLLDNALSFSPANGTVHVRGRREQSLIVVEIEDEGPGIPEGNLERIFARFYTDRPGAESFGKNSGLGLSICKDIVMAHRGEIWAENRFEALAQASCGSGGTAARKAAAQVIGSRFTVRLPATHPIILPRQAGRWSNAGRPARLLRRV